MTNPKEVEAIPVWADTVAAGTLRREPRGAVFEYTPEFLHVCQRRGWGLGFRVPLIPRVRTEGVNLHTFFAGLLPEGLRLGALIRSVKTSADDLFSLLLAACSETVGDVRVTDVSEPVLPVVDAARLETISFAQVANGDLHARNVSVLVGVDGLVRLSPAYDLVTTLPYGDRKLALKVLGRDDHLKRAHFQELAARYRLPVKTVASRLRFVSGVREPRPAPQQVQQARRSDPG